MTTSAAASPLGPDRKLYLTIGDGGANFGGNRCMANQRADAADRGAGVGEELGGLSGQDPADRSRRRHPERQPDDGRRAQPRLLGRPPQSAGAGVRPRRPALRVRARPQQRRRSEPDRVGPQLRLAQRGRAQGRQGLYLRQLVGVVAAAVRVAAGGQRQRRDSALGAAADRVVVRQPALHAAAADVLHGGQRLGLPPGSDHGAGRRRGLHRRARSPAGPTRSWR